MLDRLLGRASLKERIRELQDERDALERQLEAESERRSEAVRERQAAEERVNRLEDRISSLEDRVERAEDDAADLDFTRESTLRGDRLADVLSRLESVSTGPEGAISAMIEESVPAALVEHFGDRTPLLDRAAPVVVYADDEDLIGVALRPPVPPAPFVEFDDQFKIDRSWYEPKGRFALGVVRADRFALGEYDGRDRLSATGFESDVKGAHSKGGFSQRRFERRRDEQIEGHLSKVREHLTDREADRLYLVGESTILSEFADEATVTRPSDASGDPADALNEAFADFWSVRLAVL
ncbi:MAG: Vms1/Ankzf1 family peptidyl-tRNA hydrolase [Halanaeroarchaeum sp.]